MSDIVTQVETTLFNRMIRNAFVGFLKAAAIAGLVGAAIGAVLFGSGLLSQQFLPSGMVETCFGSEALAGALASAAAFMLPAGAFGATAGINAARDARRFLLSHEAGRPSLMPKEIDAAQAIVSHTDHGKQAEPAAPQHDWRQRLESELFVGHQLH